MKVLVLDLSYVIIRPNDRFDVMPFMNGMDVSKRWDYIESVIGNDNFKFSVDRLNEITRSFSSAIKHVRPENVFKVEHHSSVADKLSDIDDIVLHCMSYHCGSTGDVVPTMQHCDEKNWVSCLDSVKSISGYTHWRPAGVKAGVPVLKNCTSNTSVFSSRKPMKDPDYIIVCTSPHLVPPRFSRLSEIFKIIFEAMN